MPVAIDVKSVQRKKDPTSVKLVYDNKKVKQCMIEKRSRRQFTKSEYRLRYTESTESKKQKARAKELKQEPSL